MRIFLTHHPALEGKIRLDKFSGKIAVQALPWRRKADGPLEEGDYARAREWLQRHGLQPTKEETRDAVHAAAEHHGFHPVREYLSGLKWDRQPRLDTWLSGYLGVRDSAYVRSIAPKVLISAVARIFRPGCKVDTMLVLEGEQGAGKSTALKALFHDDWTLESVSLFTDHKRMVMMMQGSWCVELAEFAAVRRGDQNATKGLISTQVDTVVLPYARAPSDHPRQCIFIGTINPTEMGYLSDETGNRRYWPVTVTSLDLEGLTIDRDQLWAEAVARYQQGEPWFLDEIETEMARKEQADRAETDPWEEVLRAKLGKTIRTTNAECMDLLGIPHERKDRRAQMRAGKALRALGYEPKKVSEGGEKIRVWMLKESRQ